LKKCGVLLRIKRLAEKRHVELVHSRESFRGACLGIETGGAAYIY
jgi:hypothetical protein